MNFSNFRTYLKFLSRNKVYTFVSVAGFAISLTFVIVLTVYAKAQLSMDSFHENSDRLFLLTRSGSTGNFNPMGDYVMGVCPEVESYSRVFEEILPISSEGGEPFQGIVMLADPGFLGMFSFPFLSGDPSTALDGGNSVVLSEKTSKKIFGSGDPLNQTVFIDGDPYIVTGVMKQFPYNTHLEEPEVIIKYTNLWRFYGGDNIFSDYNYWHFTFYFLAHDNTHLPSKADLLHDKLLEDFDDDFLIERMEFVPVENIYFSEIRSELYYKKGSLASTRIYIGVVVLILIIALLNYINMTVAQAGFRCREAAVKKLLGSGKGAISRQVLAETLMLTFIAFAIALSLAFATEGYFEKLLGARLELRNIFSGSGILLIVLSICALAGLAGIIPALVLSSFKAVEVLKGTFTRKVKTGYSKILIVFQFTVCCALVICTFVMYGQASYMRNHDLGFNSEDILIIRYPGMDGPALNAVKERFLHIAGVEAVGFGVGGPLTGASNNSYELEQGRREWIRTMSGDADYFDIFGLHFEPVSGLSYGPGDDVVYLNATALNLVKPDPATMRLKAINTGEDAAIGGILNDFHLTSVHKKLEPVLFRFMPDDDGYVSMIVVKMASGDIYRTAEQVMEAFVGMGGNPFTDFFISNDEIARWYEGEKRTTGIMGAFTLLSIVIMVMGVFAMSSYIIRQKEKEIGMRKVCGATVAQVLGMLNRQSLSRVIIAYVIACPLAYYAVSKWLENFPYRIQPGVDSFILAGLLVSFFCLTSVSLQTLRAARANPVESLKSE